MSAYLYDEALVKELQKITKDSRIHIVDPNQAISFLAQFDKDKVELPVILLSRGPINILDYKNQYAYLKGDTVRINTDDNTATKMKLVPCRIDWTIDVYAADRFTCDEIVRELVMYFLTNPRFNVEVPYDIGIDQNFDVFLSDEIVDNSDLVEFPNTGEMFRETLSIHTENAHFYSSRRQYLTKVDPDVDDENIDN